MRKFLYFVCICVACWWLYDSCSGDSSKSESSESSSYSSGSGESKKSGKFENYSLTDPASLMGILSGKTFTGYKGTSGQMTVSGSGGTFDGTHFTISSVKIVNDKMGQFSYYVPSYNMSGTVAVVITDDEITLHESNGSNYIYE
ncbi:MAG: hypothetical protein K2N05_03045 [Muribaculaceae bacterium]|nr:hypothetical protein [Muribaculaceae bacterium]